MTFMQRWMTELVWTAPGAFWLVIPVAWAFLRARRTRRSDAIPFGPLALMRAHGGNRVTWRLRGERLLDPAFAVGLAFLLLAAAGPAAPRAVPEEREGVDMYLCLDVSSSMAVRDGDGPLNRLDAARAAALAFLERRGNDSVGLFAFARFPDLISPPTLDHEAVAVALHDLKPLASDDPEDATAIGAALARAVDALRSTSSPTPVVVLVTDGRENVATETRPGEIAPLHAGQLAVDLGVRIYIIMTGSGADARDVGALETVAEMTGGRSFRAGDAPALQGAFSQIDDLETRPVRHPLWVMDDRSLPLLLIAMLLLVGVRLLRAGPFEVLP